MKTKKQLTIIILITGLCVTGIVYGDDPVKGAPKDAATSTSGTGLGWQEQTKRTNVLVSNGLNLSTGISVNMTGLNWNIGVSSNLTIIECCQATTIKESWCNFNADDERCKD